MAESKIQNDQYGLLKDFQGFTEKYFEVSPDNSKLGLFGYMNEIVAHATKVSQYHRNALYNEIALNTASLPSTIYGAAADEGIDAMEAVPAKATVLLTILTSDLANAINAQPNRVLKIDRETFVISMDKTYFRLPFSMYILPNGNSVMAVYASTDIQKEYWSASAEEPLIPGLDSYKKNIYIEAITLPASDSTDGKSYTQFRIDVYQYDISSESHDLTSTNLSSSINFQVDLEDQLAGFTVFYKDNDEDEYHAISKYQSRSLVVSDTPYCLYTFIDENSFQILFDLSSDGWRPSNASSVIIKSCTTTGTDGNFKFDGELSAEDTNLSLPMTAYINNHPAGGKNRPSIQELKQAVYEKRLKVEVLSTPDDLNAYFAKLSSSLFNGISQVKFQRYKDNILHRIFRGYLLLGDSKGRPFPSNTAMQLELEADEGRCPTINASIPIIPKLINGKESLTRFEIANIEDLNDLITNGRHVYFSPFVIQQYNNETFRYFDLSINEFLQPFFTKVFADSDSNPVLNYLKIRRKLFTSKFSIGEENTTNIANMEGIDHITVELVSSFTETDPKKAFLVILSSEYSSEQLGILYTPSDSEEITKSYFGKMVADSEIQQTSGEGPLIKISSVCKTTDAGEPRDCFMFRMNYGEELPLENSNGETADNCVHLGETVTAKIYILEDYTEFAATPDHDSMLDSTSGGTANYPDLARCVANRSHFSAEAQEYFDPAKYRVKAVAEVNEKIHMFTDMSDIFDSTYSHEGSSHTLYEVPLIGMEVAVNDSYYEEFIAEYKNYIKQLKDTISSLVNNTEINIKLFNSYGPSKKWLVRTSTLEDASEELEAIGSSDIEIEVDLERENGQDDEVEAEAKKIIENFFRDLNKMEDNNLIINSKVSLTKLTTAIEKAIPSISACNIISIGSGTLGHKVVNPRFLVLNSEEGSTVIPEYTSIGLPIDTNPDNRTVFPDSPKIKFHYTF